MSTQQLDKIFSLGRLLLVRPLEFYDRLQTFWEAKSEQASLSSVNYDTSSVKTVMSLLNNIFENSSEVFSQESACMQMVQHIKTRKAELDSIGTIDSIHNSDFELSIMCYVLCRIIQPDIIVETGVAYGVNTSFILAALNENNKGLLHSVDLPPIGSRTDDFVGAFVPEELTNRWRLHRGTTKRVLPPLMDQLSSVDIFVHDSLHTFKNMNFEFKTAHSKLSRPGVIISDDIEGNGAFAKLTVDTDPKYHAAIKESEKSGIFGIAIY